jgi:DNA-binding response OmpR family regulator
VSRSVAHGGPDVKGLVVTNDERLARFLGRVLFEEGLAVDLCARGTEALAQAEDSLYDLVVLDWRVPETDGLTVCREIRRAGCTTPIVVLAPRGERGALVLALEAGADACAVQPPEASEFVARVRALLRRTSGFAALRCGDLEIDRAKRQAKLGGVALTLTNREYALLLHLLHGGDRIVSRSDLLTHVWGAGFDAGPNVVEMLVCRLRDKLGDRAWMVETVRGLGYRVRRQPPSSGSEPDRA